MERRKNMNKPYNSSALAKQVSEKLGLDEERGLKLYKELSQVPNGMIKEVLDILSRPASDEINIASEYPVLFAGIMSRIQGSRDNAVKKYAACIRRECVRGAQYSKWKDAMPLDDDAWVYADKPLFVEIVEAGTPVCATQIAAAYAGVTEDVIELYSI